MSHPVVFIPDNNDAVAQRLKILMIALLFIILVGVISKNLWSSGIVAPFLLWVVATNKYTLRVEVATDKCILTHYYTDFWGKEHSSVIGLATATGDYGRRRLTKNSWGGRLNLKDTADPYAKIVLTEGKNGRFSRVQLNQIVDLIKQCNQNLHFEHTSSQS